VSHMEQLNLSGDHQNLDSRKSVWLLLQYKKILSIPGNGAKLDFDFTMITKELP